MIKIKKIFLVLLIIFLIYFVMIFDVNLLYPYYVLKDLILSPVNALIHDED